MWRMLQQDDPDDFVIATGEATPRGVRRRGVRRRGLDWHDHVDIDRTLFRPSDIRYSRGNPAKARRLLGWEAKTRFDELVKLLVKSAGETIAHADA